MILKMRTVDEGWYYYQVPKNIKYRTLTKEQYNSGMATNAPTHCNIETDKTESVLVICIDDSAIIYTNMIAYLLNDSGKTIDTLTV